jgi:hypothetical protein
MIQAKNTMRVSKKLLLARPMKCVSTFFYFLVKHILNPLGLAKYEIRQNDKVIADVKWVVLRVQRNPLKNRFMKHRERREMNWSRFCFNMLIYFFGPVRSFFHEPVVHFNYFIFKLIFFLELRHELMY